MRIRQTLLIVLAVGLFSASYNPSSAQTWQKAGSTFPSINRIIINDSDPSQVWVASDLMPVDLSKDVISFPNFGQGVLLSKDGGKTFPDTILQNFVVFDIIRSGLDANKMYAAVRKLTRGGIVVSNDNGKTWTDEYSMLGEGTLQYMHLRSKLNNGKEDFFAAAINTSNGYLTSNNDFETLDNHDTLKIQAHDIEFSQAKTGLVFMAGDHESQGQIFRSFDNGLTWKYDTEGLEGLRIHCVMPHPTNPAVVFCGADSVDNFKKIAIGKGIYSSQDTGKTWHIESAAGAQVFDIAYHPSEKRFLAAACGSQGVYVASQYGFGWEQYNDGLPANASARVVAIPNIASTDKGIVVYAGIFNEGLYKSKNITSSVDSRNDAKDFKISGVYPQPANSYLNINFDNPSDCIGDMNLRDVYGNKVLELKGAYFTKGTNTISLEDLSLCNAGAYFLTISVPSGITTQKVIISR